MVSEMTGNYNLLLPTLWVCSLAFLLSDEQSIYNSQVLSRSRSPAHQGSYVREVLAGLKVAAFVTPVAEVPVVAAGARVPEVIESLNRSPSQVAAVLDGDGCYGGVVSVEEVLLASRSPDLLALLVAADLTRGAVTPLRADDPVDYAMELFVESDLLALPVVDGSGRLVGLVKRADLAGAYLRRVAGPPVVPTEGPPPPPAP
jgi:CIC family chloride channel protein